MLPGADRASLVPLPAFRVCGISCRTSNSRPQQIGQLWQRYFQQTVREQVTQRLHDKIFSVYYEYESDHTGDYTLLLGHEVPAEAEIPNGLVAKDIPVATYRVIEARGEQPAAVIAAWQQVWASHLPRAYSVDFDLYKSPDIVLLHIALREPSPAV